MVEHDDNDEVVENEIELDDHDEKLLLLILVIDVHDTHDVIIYVNDDDEVELELEEDVILDDEHEAQVAHDMIDVEVIDEDELIDGLLVLMLIDDDEVEVDDDIVDDEIDEIDEQLRELDENEVHLIYEFDEHDELLIDEITHENDENDEIVFGETDEHDDYEHQHIVRVLDMYILLFDDVDEIVNIDVEVIDDVEVEIITDDEVWYVDEMRDNLYGLVMVVHHENHLIEVTLIV